MLKKSLLIALALLLLPVSIIVSTGTVTAAVETEASLKARLLTNVELRAAIESSGSTLRFPTILDIPDIKFPELVSSGRLYQGNNGSEIFISLLSYIDGRNLPVSRRDEVLSGKFATDVIGGYFDSNEYVGDFGTVLSQNDLIQGFLARNKGKDFEVVTVSFIQGNIFGIVFYSTPGSNDGTEAFAAYGGQTAKLP